MSGTGDILLDMESKYSDIEIRDVINRSHISQIVCNIGLLEKAKAMIAYNQMVDQRWVRYYGTHLEGGAEARFIDPDKEYREKE